MVGKSAWTALTSGEHRTFAIRHTEMCLLGSCSQLQLMSLDPGWDYLPLGDLLGAQTWLCQHLTPCLNLYCYMLGLAAVKKPNPDASMAPQDTWGCHGPLPQTQGQCWSTASFRHQPPCHVEKPTALALAGKPAGSVGLGCPVPLAGSAACEHSAE